VKVNIFRARQSVKESYLKIDKMKKWEIFLVFPVTFPCDRRHWL
jgi:hypothetical protein